VKVTLQTAGFEGVPLEVELQRTDGESPETVEKKTITPTGPLTSLEFKLPATDVGRHAYSLKLPVQEDETHDDNNTREFAVTVVDDRAKVLLVEDEPRWEFRYLETAFSRDERIDLKSVVFQQPYLGLLPETFFPRKLPGDQPSPFADVDVVILGDVAPGQITDDQWNAPGKIRRRRRRNAGAVGRKELAPVGVPLGGARSAHADGVAGEDQHHGCGRPGAAFSKRIAIAAHPGSRAATDVHFDDDPASNRAVWSRLPGPIWLWLGTAKPAATVWTAALLPQQAGLADERKQALIAHHHFGFGQVVWIGFDSTWRWRHRVGDKYHHQFWGQLVRWAVSNKIAAGNEFVRFGAERSEVAAGEDVVLRTRWSPQFLQRFPKLTVRAEILRSGDNSEEPFATVDLPFKPDQPVLREGKAVNLPPGEYRTRLVVRDADLGPKPLETTFAVRPPNTPELIDITANRELLSQLADASGGRLLLADDVHRLPQLLHPTEMSQDIYRESPLWDRGWMLALFFALLDGRMGCCGSGTGCRRKPRGIAPAVRKSRQLHSASKV